MADKKDDGGGSLHGMAEGALKITESGPFKALLNPAFEPLGQFLGEVSADWVDRLRQKRNERLDRHRQKVLELEPASESDEPSERQAVLLIDWIESAQRVDPDRESELSAMWQAVLGRIVHDGDRTEEMIDALRKLDNRKAKIIIGWTDSVPNNQDQRIDLDRLREYGLLYREGIDGYAVLRSALRLGSILVLLLMATSVRDVLEYTLPSAAETPPFGGFYNSGVAIVRVLQIAIVLVFVMGLVRRIRNFGVYRLTGLGKLLQETGKRYLVKSMKTKTKG